MTESVSPIADKVAEVMKKVAWDGMVDSALAAVYALPYIGPVLSIPGIRDLVSLVAHAFSDMIFAKLKLGLDVAIIIGDNALALGAYDRASVTLAVIARDPARGIDSKEFKDARDRAREALGRFLSHAPG